MSEHGGGGGKTVEETFVLTDKMSAPLRGILGGVNKLSSAMNNASSLVGSLASVGAVIGGAFSLHGAIEETMNYITQIQKIKAYTGATTQVADGLVGAFESVGVTAEESAGILGRMSRQAERMELAMAGTQGHLNPMKSMWKQIGVDIDKGPLANLESMSTAAKLALQFRIPLDKALQVNKLLQKGPEYIREAVKEGRLTDADVASAQRMKQARYDITKAYGEIQRAIGTKLLPFIADMLQKGAANMKQWVGYAEQFGETLGGFLKEHYKLILNIGKALLANAALMKLTGGTGAIGTVAKVGGWIANGSPKGPAGGGIINGLTAMSIGLSNGLGAFAKLFTSGAGLMRLGGILARFSVVGAVLAAAYGIFVAIKDNVMGIRTYLVDLWDRITLRFEGIKVALEPLFDAFSSDKEGSIGHFFGVVIAGVIKGLGTMVESVMEVIHFSINVAKAFYQGGAHAFLHPAETMEKAFAMTQNDMVDALSRHNTAAWNEAMGATSRSTTTQPPQQHFDFRGSRFDIKQAFAEGFDADRIADVFTHDIGALGERKLQSGLAPLFSVR